MCMALVFCDPSLVYLTLWPIAVAAEGITKRHATRLFIEGSTRHYLKDTSHVQQHKK